MKEKILILGGFGFLGSTIYKHFENDSNYQVYRESRQSGCDVLDYKKLKDKIDSIKPTVIIFCSANVGSVNYVSEYAAEVIDENLRMILNLYKVVSEVNKNILIINPLANCSYPGIIDIQHEKNWWDGKIHESVESYGMYKKTSFIISECYKKQHKIKTINLMLSGGFGEGDHLNEEKTHAMNGIIMRMIKAKKTNQETFTVWGTGNPVREWIYMPDVAKLIKNILDSKNYDIPNPINVAQQNGITIKDIVLSVKEELDYNGEIVYDTTKQDGAPIKILGNELFNKFFPDFTFTNYNLALKKTINYYLEKI